MGAQAAPLRRAGGWRGPRHGLITGAWHSGNRYGSSSPLLAHLPGVWTILAAQSRTSRGLASLRRQGRRYCPQGVALKVSASLGRACQESALCLVPAALGPFLGGVFRKLSVTVQFVSPWPSNDD